MTLDADGLAALRDSYGRTIAQLAHQLAERDAQLAQRDEPTDGTAPDDVGSTDDDQETDRG